VEWFSYDTEIHRGKGGSRRKFGGGLELIYCPLISEMTADVNHEKSAIISEICGTVIPECRRYLIQNKKPQKFK
jgi:hypothetical protein